MGQNCHGNEKVLRNVCWFARGEIGRQAGDNGVVVALRSSLSAAHAEANELRVATRRLEAELGMIAQAADEVGGVTSRVWFGVKSCREGGGGVRSCV